MCKEKSMLTSRNVAELQFSQEDCSEMKTAREVSEMLGISKRTLQYYNEIGLVKPSRIDSSTGYWKYGEKRIEQLKEIIVLREIGYTLREIKEIIDKPGVDLTESLESRIRSLELKVREIRRSIRMAKRVKEYGITELASMWEEKNKAKRGI